MAIALGGLPPRPSLVMDFDGRLGAFENIIQATQEHGLCQWPGWQKRFDHHHRRQRQQKLKKNQWRQLGTFHRLQRNCVKPIEGKHNGLLITQVIKSMFTFSLGKN
jgi:hypothetical protein